MIDRGVGGMHFLVIILVVSIIITISKIVMEFIKKRDRKNGLYLDDRYYSIIGTLISPANQDKRLEKEQRKKFNDYSIDEAMWKKSYFFFLILSSLGLIIAIIYKCDIVALVLAVTFATLLFFTKKMLYLTLEDIIILASIIYNSLKFNIPIFIIFPAVIMMNYVIIRDYKAYRKSLSEKDN